MIETWIISIGSLLIGYMLGKGITPIDTAVQLVNKARQELKKHGGRVGALRQPTAQDIWRTKNPEGIKQAEGDQAMKELIQDNLVQ